MGQGQLVVLAAECANRGMDIDATIKLVEKQIPKTRTFALLDDLRYSVRGGRVPAWVKTVADLLHLKPIIATKPDGRISLAGFLFGRRNRTARFARFIARRVIANEAINVGIGHAVCEEEASLLADQIRMRMPLTESLAINGLGPGLGVHGGPGTLLASVSPVVSFDNLASGVD